MPTPSRFISNLYSTQSSTRIMNALGKARYLAKARLTLTKVIANIFLFSALMLSIPAHAKFEYMTWDKLSKEQQELVLRAQKARQNAYAPYSHYQVGAALRTVEGQIFTGSNVENASYGLTICAERVSVFKAVSEGKAAVKSIALVTKNAGMPCGACRQVLNEFNPNLEIIVTDVHHKKVLVTTLKELLPEGFGPHNL